MFWPLVHTVFPQWAPLLMTTPYTSPWFPPIGTLAIESLQFPYTPYESLILGVGVSTLNPKL